jgi:hypothetical protein
MAEVLKKNSTLQYLQFNGRDREETKGCEKKNNGRNQRVWSIQIDTYVDRLCKGKIKVNDEDIESILHLKSIREIILFLPSLFGLTSDLFSF